MQTTRATRVAGVTLRPATADDREFLYRVYAASRADEMAMVVDWSDAQKETFLRQQFHAQDHQYHEHYPDARYDLIVRDGENAGRLYVQPMGHEIRVMDIALLPEHRGQGIGGALMGEVMDEARESGRFVSLHVEEHNPARRLYQRLGFVDAGEVTFYKLMHWVPPGHTPVFADGPADGA